MELSEIKSVGPKTISILNKMGIYDDNDLREYYPYRYDIIKRTDLYSEKVIIDGVVETIPQVSFFGKRKNRLSLIRTFLNGLFIPNVPVFINLLFSSNYAIIF